MWCILDPPASDGVGVGAIVANEFIHFTTITRLGITIQNAALCLV